MHRGRSAALIVLGVALMLLGLLFLAGAAGQVRRLAVAGVSLVLGAASAGYGVRGWRAAEASSPEAIQYYVNAFGVKRVVLPRVLNVPEIAALNAAITCETEVFVFGGLCVMAEGRCSLSSYITGRSPNMNGVCSPASHVSYDEDGDDMISKLGGYTINRFASDETAGYPTLCKGRFTSGGKAAYVFEEPVSLNAIDVLPQLYEAGVTALKIEGRQRGRAYVRKVVEDFRRAVDALGADNPLPAQDLAGLSEGQAQTAGVYNKIWR